MEKSVNAVDVTTERNLFVLLSYLCCIVPIGIPNIFKRRKSEELRRAKTYFRASQLWALLALMLLVLGVSTFGFFQLWKFYAGMSLPKLV